MTSQLSPAQLSQSSAAKQPFIKNQFAFSAILFDCDGVLVDSELITLRVMSDWLNHIGLKITFEQTIARFLGKALQEEIPAIESELGRAVPEDFISGFRERRNLALAQDIVAIKGVREVIDQLKELGIPYAVASGADRVKMGITLGKTNLLSDFEHALVGSDMVEHTKPAPDVYLKAAQLLGVDPKHCLVIDDTPTGTQAGVAAGATVLGFCAFTDPKLLLDAGASAVFNSMAELPKLLGLR